LPSQLAKPYSHVLHRLGRVSAIASTLGACSVRWVLTRTRASARWLEGDRWGRAGNAKNRGL